jgi:hypothetical protein
MFTSSLQKRKRKGKQLATLSLSLSHSCTGQDCSRRLRKRWNNIVATHSTLLLLHYFCFSFLWFYLSALIHIFCFLTFYSPSSSKQTASNSEFLEAAAVAAPITTPFPSWQRNIEASESPASTIYLLLQIHHQIPASIIVCNNHSYHFIQMFSGTFLLVHHRVSSWKYM